MSTTTNDLGTPDELSEREQNAVEAQLFRLADDEYVQAERYTFWQVRAPTLESDLSISNNAQDELGHARLWYDAIQQFGYSEESLLWESEPSDFQHSTLVELPFEEGDWANAIVRAYLYDVAEEIRLRALEESTYRPIRDRTSRALGEESYHVEHAISWLERLSNDSEGNERLQSALEQLYPYALTLFEPVGDIEEDIVELGIRTRTLDEMRAEWDERISAQFDEIGLTVPEATPATPIGRNGKHTDHWESLYEEMTSSYRNLGRDRATRIMAEDEDEDDAR